jgi:uncharacterized alkaline shock family protein YloU
MTGIEQAPAEGTVRVANEVIATIAAMAAREVEGVMGMDDASARHLGDWLKRQTAHDGVRVVVDATKAIHLELFLCVASQAQISDVAEQVQATAVESVERMLGLEVAEVNVFVSSIAFRE